MAGESHILWRLFLPVAAGYEYFTGYSPHCNSGSLNTFRIPLQRRLSARRIRMTLYLNARGPILRRHYKAHIVAAQSLPIPAKPFFFAVWPRQRINLPIFSGLEDRLRDISVGGYPVSSLGCRKRRLKDIKKRLGSGIRFCTMPNSPRLSSLYQSK